MKELSSGGVCKFGDPLTRKAPVKIIRDHQQAFCACENFRAASLQGEQLVKRVQFHELKAGLSKDFLPRNFFERLVHDPACPGIAIMERLAKQLIRFGKEDEINTPGIDAYGLDGFAVN